MRYHAHRSRCPGRSLARVARHIPTRALPLPLRAGARVAIEALTSAETFVRMFGAISTEKQKPRSSPPRLAATEMTPNLLAS